MSEVITVIGCIFCTGFTLNEVFYATANYLDDLCALQHNQKVLRLLVYDLFCNGCRDHRCALSELAQARPSPPPCHLHRANLLRSHPPHFALTARPSTPPPPQSSEMRRLAPTPHHVFKLLSIVFGVGQGRCEEQVKSGNFNWSHRQF